MSFLIVKLEYNPNLNYNIELPSPSLSMYFVNYGILTVVLSVVIVWFLGEYGSGETVQCNQDRILMD